MSILALSGWGQPHDVLATVLPGATHLDYAAQDNVAAAIAHIADAAQNHEAVIGWSLGGQLAVRAIAAGLMRPKKLVLIAAPFQFVENEDKKLGMKRDQFDKFRDNYAKSPSRTLAKAWELIAKGDKHTDVIRAKNAQYNAQAMLQKDWLGWLNRLDGFSCDGLNFSEFPPTLLLHGKNDVVVGAEQSRIFSTFIPHAKHIVLPDCGHAPHWHDTALVQRVIEEHLHV